MQHIRNTILVSITGLFFLAVLAAPSRADFKTRLERPQQGFIFYQLNFAAGFDSAEPDDFGPADRGARTQFTVEFFSKDKKALQRGYTRFMQPSQWNFKLGVELDPAENRSDDPGLNLRLFDAWVRFDTKWDRTSFWFGNRSIPFGHNPKLDPGLSFLPNQAPLDLGFGRDIGVFFKTPVSAKLDLDVAVTAGGFLAGNLLTVRDTAGGSYDIDDAITYRDTWLITTRIGQTSFGRSEQGIFAAVGTVHRDPAKGEPLEISRLGYDWTFKHKEDWALVNQISGGENRGDGRGSRFVANLLNSLEVFLNSRWRTGFTHTLRVEDFDIEQGDRVEVGTVFATLSYALTRGSRLRLNPFFEYRHTAESRDSGVLLQYCTGCGWRK